MLLSGRCKAFISWPPLHDCSIEARLAHLSPEADQASTLATVYKALEQVRVVAETTE